MQHTATGFNNNNNNNNNNNDDDSNGNNFGHQEDDLSWLNPASDAPLMGTGSIQLQDPVSDIPPQHDPAYFYDSTQQFDTNWAEPDNQGNNNNNNNNKGGGIFSLFNNNNNRNTKQPLVNTVNRQQQQQQSPLASNEYGATSTTTSPTTTDNPVFLPPTHYATLPTSNNMTEKFPGEDDPLVNPDDVDEEEEEEGLIEPHKNPCLHCLHFVEFLVIIVLLGVLAAQIVPLFFLSPAQIGRVQTALRGYMTLFCIIFILVEARTPLPFLQTHLLRNLISRGMLYSFLGLVALDQAVAVNAKSAMVNGLTPGSLHLSWQALFMQITAYSLTAIGGIYMVLGILCVGALKSKMEKDLEDEWADYRKHKREGV